MISRFPQLLNHKQFLGLPTFAPRPGRTFFPLGMPAEIAGIIPDDLNCFQHNDDVNDDGTFNLPVLTHGGFGFAVIEEDAERVFFTIKADGTVNLIIASDNIVANADTDTKMCIGTSVASPCVIKNRLGAAKRAMLILWYD